MYYIYIYIYIYMFYLFISFFPAGRSIAASGIVPSAPTPLSHKMTCTSNVI